MRRIPLTSGLFALIDDADYSFISKYVWRAENANNVVYAVAKINGIKTKLHHLFLPFNVGFVVDHIDHNSLNNCRDNLRYLSHSENLINGRIRRVNKSGKTGAYFDKRTNKWKAFIGKMHLGTFDDLQSAILAREKAEEQYFPGIIKVSGVKMELPKLENVDKYKMRYKIGVSGYRCVARNGNKWMALFRENRKTKFLGNFETELAAATCYVAFFKAKFGYEPYKI